MNMDPMTMLMLQSVMKGQPQQQYGQPGPGGPSGNVQTSAAANPISSAAGALGGIMPMLLAQALQKRQGVQAANAAPGSILGMPGVHAPVNPAVDPTEGL